MQTDSPTHSGATAVRNLLVGGAGLNAVLILAGWIVFPTTANYPASWLGLACDGLMLAAYAVIGWKAVPAVGRRDPRILPAALVAGGLSGAIFLAEIVLEYALLPENNTAFGIAEFDAVLAACVLAAVVVAVRTGRVGAAALTAAGSALIGSTAFLTALLPVSYAFHGTSRQAQVFQAEGNYEDFEQSGMADFDAFIMQDFMGAAFFHSLLLPPLAAALGSAGGLAGAGAAKLWRSGSRRDVGRHAVPVTR